MAARMHHAPFEKLSITGDRDRFAAEVGALAAHPAMRRAARAFCDGFVAQFEHRPLLNLIVSDRGRLLMAWMALYLDASYDPGDPLSGLTVNRFKTACYNTGFCSRGRAAAMIGVMRFAGHLEPAHEMRKGYPLRLVPTEKLKSAIRMRLENTFAAIAEILPKGRLGLLHLGDPEFERHFIRVSCDEFLARERPVDLAPAIRPFSESKAGFMILMALAIASASPGIPNSDALSVPISQLSARFSVSRAQVKDLIDVALAEGLLEKAAENRTAFVMTPVLQESFLKALSAFFIVGTQAIRAATAAIELHARSSD